MRRVRSQRAVAAMQMHQVRLKPKLAAGLPGQPETGHRATRADQHQSLTRERPLCPVPSSQVRSVSAWSPKPLLVLSSSQTVVHELSQAFSGHQLAFRQEFVSKLLHFSILSSQMISPFFWMKSLSVPSLVSSSFLLLRLGVETRSPPEAVGPKALELCVMALDLWCRSFPLPPFFVAPEDRGGQQQHGPASIWQLAEVIAIVQRTREVTRSSAFACELRAADSPRPLAFISNLSFLSSRLVQGWPQVRLKGDFLQCSGPLSRSCSCGKNHRVLRGLAHRGQFATQVLPVFPVSCWAAVLQATDKTLRDGVTSQKGCFQECGEGANEIHGYSSSPWVTNLSSSPGSLMDSFEKFMAASLPALAETSSHNPAACISHVDYRGSSISSGIAGVVPASPTVDSNRFVVPRGILQLSLFEKAVLWRMLELESVKPGVGVVGACGLSDYGVVQAGRSAG